MFTTHEQLAVAEEKQAELAAEVQQAKQVAAIAEQALAASHTVRGPAQPAQVRNPKTLSLHALFVVVAT